MVRVKNLDLRNKVLKRLREQNNARTATMAKEFDAQVTFIHKIRREKLHLNATDKDDPEGWYCQPCNLHVRNPHTCPHQPSAWVQHEQKKSEREEREERKAFAEQFVKERDARKQAATEEFTSFVSGLDDEEQSHDAEIPTSNGEQLEQVAGPYHPDAIMGEIVDAPTAQQINRPVVSLSDVPPLTVRQALIAFSRAVRGARDGGQEPETFADEAQNPQAALVWIETIQEWLERYHTRLEERAK